jgi:uncharacterized iron-regulated membrane protein
MPVPARLRTALWTVHRWIALSLCVLLVPIAISGALLVWKDEIDTLLHPGRYAVSGGKVAQPLSAYIASTRGALGEGLQPLVVRLPEAEGRPVQVQARRSGRGSSGPAQLITAYLDPSTGRVLDTVEFRSSLFGVLHRFHENLTIPAWSGRSINGWAGVGMLTLALTGLWLWWPRNGAFLPGLRWRRAPAATTNLHHLLGFWISLPLAFVSLTGVYLAFPQSARSMMTSIAPMNPPVRSPLRGQFLQNAAQTPDAVLRAALAAVPAARPVAVFMPMLPPEAGRSRDAGRARNGNRGSPAWHVQVRKPGAPEVVTLLVDDASGAVRPLPDPLAGDRAAQWIRWLHEGSHSGPVWRVIVFLTGVFPPIFAVTGVLMWLRGRRQRRTALGTDQPLPQGDLQAAE